MKVIICDIDGTLADCSERRKRATRENGEIAWEIFLDPLAVAKDKVDPVIKSLLIHHQPVMLVTGRHETLREITEGWLSKNGICYYGLFMRKDGDFRPDDVVKKEIYEKEFKKHIVDFVLDDRDSVVKMWRSLGLKCFQVAEGDF